jgi:hypothetical protein
MSRKKNEPKILLDSDVVIHFIKGGQSILLPKAYPGRFVMLDKVHTELSGRHSDSLPIQNFLNWCGIPIIAMPLSKDIYKEYASLKKGMGDGEAACLAVARYQKEFVASSNLSDIRTYCEQNGIVYLTTMDILLEIYEQGLLTEAECDQFIYDVKSKNSRLIDGIDTIEDYKIFKRGAIEEEVVSETKV